MLTSRIAVVLSLVAACSTETTSFRTTDETDGMGRNGPSAAVYDVRVADQATAHVRVSSNGGYIGNSEEPMTHVGFEIRNTGQRALAFDGDTLALAVFDNTGAGLPPTKLTAITPLGPALIPIAPGATISLDSYFMLPVRPRVVDSMRVYWSLRSGDDFKLGSTRFVRDDSYPVIDYQPPRESLPTGASS